MVNFSILCNYDVNFNFSLTNKRTVEG